MNKNHKKIITAVLVSLACFSFAVAADKLPEVMVGQTKVTATSTIKNLTFNNLNSYVSVPDASDLKFTEGNLSISLWFKKTDSDGGALISKPWNTENEYNYAIQTTSNSIKWHLGGPGIANGFQFNYDRGGIPLNDGQWHHLVATVSSTEQPNTTFNGTMAMYFDGVQVEDSITRTKTKIITGAKKQTTATGSNTPLTCQGATVLACKMVTSQWSYGLLPKNASYCTSSQDSCSAQSAGEPCYQRATACGDQNLPLAIGTYYPYDAGSTAFTTNQVFGGNIKEVRMYDRILSAAEALGLASGNAPPSNGVIATWPLNEGSGTAANDTSGNSHNGTLINGASWQGTATDYYGGYTGNEVVYNSNASGKTTGKSLTPSLNFNNLNSYVSVPDENTLEFKEGDLNISLWFKKTDSDGGALISKPWNWDGEYNYVIYTTGSTIRWFLGEQGVSGGFLFTYDHGSALNDNNWHHLVATAHIENDTVDTLKGAMTMYFDGVAVKDKDTPASPTKTISNTPKRTHPIASPTLPPMTCQPNPVRFSCLRNTTQWVPGFLPKENPSSGTQYCASTVDSCPANSNGQACTQSVSACGDRNLPLAIGTFFPYGTNPGSWPQPNHVFGGNISEVRVYNRDLTTAEISALYNITSNPINGMNGYWKLNEGSGTNIVDSSGNGNTGATVNGPVWSYDGPFVADNGPDLFGFNQDILFTCAQSGMLADPDRCFRRNTNGAGSVTVMNSRTSINGTAVTETAALFYPPKTVVGDVYGSMDNFAFWGRNLHQASGTAGSDASWTTSNYPINPNAQSSWNGTEFAKNTAKITTLKGEAPELSSFIFSSGTWYLQGTAATLEDNGSGDAAKYPEGKIWKVNGNVTINNNSTISYRGKGTIIVNGDLTIGTGVNITPLIPPVPNIEDRLGFIVLGSTTTLPPNTGMGGNVTLNGNNKVQASIYCPGINAGYGAITVAGTGNTELIGSFVANRFDITADNTRFYYDYALDSAWPPGFRFLNMPHPAETKQ